MEFEKNIPPTAEDIALADIPKVTIHPLHKDLSLDSRSFDRSHSNEGTFSFEHETTEQHTHNESSLQQHPHRTIALTAALSSVVTLCLVIAITLIVR